MNALSRRDVLHASGALVVSFTIAPYASAEGTAKAKSNPALPGDLAKAPYLDSWIRIGADGRITVFTGKAELGQGIKTAIAQVAAEELEVSPKQIALITADTAQTPDEGYTAGSHSMQDSATAVRNAAAQARALLVAEAAREWNLPGGTLFVANGTIAAPDGRKVRYGDLAARLSLHVEATARSPLTNPRAYRLIGRSLPRVDIPAKLAGGAAFVQDLRLPGMVHARVVRPPGTGARLVSVDTGPVSRMPQVLQVIRNGDYLAVVAAREWEAILAARALAAGAHWSEPRPLPDQAHIDETLQHLPAQEVPVFDKSGPVARSVRTRKARYTRPYLMHAAIGPSCAVALFKNNELTVWTHAQGVFPLRNALSELLRLPGDSIRCIHVEGAGCYGHNGADDAAADAALIAQQVPGRPVRVQWMREDEHAHEPYGPAMIVDSEASLDARGRVAEWRHAVWSNTHAQRPGKGGLFLQNALLPNPLPVPPPKPLPMPAGGGDRNSIPLYEFPDAHVVYHFIPEMPLRVSALRSLGGQMNVFAIESFMDELALAAGADPVAFRLKHLSDPRAAAAIRAAAQRFDWTEWRGQGPHHGKGFAFARYKNLAAYCAVALDLSVEPETGAIKSGRVVAAVDAGEAVNPDGIRNQIEGAILQAASWTLLEQVTFDRKQITSRDWSSYPILRFDAAPESVEVIVLDRPGTPFLGVGEAGQGPASAAIANALARAGARIRDLPLTPARVRAALAKGA
ncbi:MAG TPA: molybdopterin cofactor-binding domain-containing protein [Rhizomicrobium sp.]|jgi:CO/xanthine dehydrogenase Mo-binding subunit